MISIRFDQPHLWISLTLYISCLFFVGFYHSILLTPMHAFGLLLMGWLVFPPFWLANPIFIFVWFYSFFSESNSKNCLYFGALALLCSLSFLLLNEVTINEAGHKSEITAYGLGYFLWIASIMVFTLGEFFNSAAKSNSKYFSFNFISQSTFVKVLCYLTIIFITAAIYIDHYLTPENGVYKVQRDSKQAIQTLCLDATEKFYTYAGDVQGVFVEYGGEAPPSILKKLPYMEQKSKPNDKTTMPFVRIMSGSYERVPSNNVDSNYKVEKKDHTASYRKSLGFYVQDIVVTSLPSLKVVAEKRQVHKTSGTLLCPKKIGKKDSSYYEREFFKKVFKLQF